MTGADRRLRLTAMRGFTLMEMLIVMGIFALVLVAATDIFLLSNRSQRKTLSMERVQADARYAIETMVREIRSGAIDYPWYDTSPTLGIPETGAVEALAVIDGQGDRIRFYKSQSPAECDSVEADSCLLVSMNGGTPQVVTPSGVNVHRAAFYIRPNLDPYEFDNTVGEFLSDAQPRVTITLVMQNITNDPRERTTVHLQTTAGTRNFRR